MNLLKRLRFQIRYLRSNPPWDTGISPPELVQFLEAHKPGRALDLGCGTGTNVITMAQHGWNATGVDFAWNAIRSAKKKARNVRGKAKFYVEDVTHLKHAKGPFDLVLDIGCYHTLSSEERTAYLQQLPTLLKEGSTYLLYAFFKEPGEDGPGITEADIPASDGLVLVNRKNGSERGLRPSAWMTYRKES